MVRRLPAPPAQGVVLGMQITTILDRVEDFIARWQAAGGSERANYQLFLNELTVLLNPGSRYGKDRRFERGAGSRQRKGGPRYEILCGMYAAGTHRIVDG